MENKEKFVSPTIYKVARPFLKALFYFLFQPRIKGKENFPKDGSAVIAGNHVFVFDPALIGSCTKRCVHFLAKAEIYNTRFISYLMTKAGMIPVHRQRKDHAALEAAENYLKEGALIALFPEATIIKPEGVRILPFKMGAIKMAYDTNSPIVPVTINGRYIPLFGKLEIIVHKPYYIESDDLEAEREKLVQIICGGLNSPLKEGERIVVYDKDDTKK
ncbi:MAG: 1-acyl-sn-glycerol-3-phosphate acyltransferase [Clostridia bacterium]|nr:1-acyl-sn-glycerol-3-phosphate acyltransferase [Clostridia bacterium]